MTAPRQEKSAWHLLDRLAHGRSRSAMPLSANDALVQVSLPLVLILAIATRLMTLAQSVSQMEQQAPVILDLWKQQLILRLDAVLGGWQEQAGLDALTDVDQVKWSGGWPDDERFRRLCTQTEALAQGDRLADELYRAALQYRPNEASMGEAASAFHDLYDPQVSPQPAAPVPPEFTVNDERRAFARRYIESRSRRWQEQVEKLQWQAVGRAVAALPVEDKLSDARTAVQMARIADELATRGYPLLPSVRNEYGGAP